tara:strand:+ start:1438 stop:1710 length:273 start_codon:yes stop_codon:yes gene_type:complete
MEKFIKRWQDFLANMNASEGYSHAGDDSMGAAKPPARLVPGDPELKDDSVFNEPFNGGGTSAHDDRNGEEAVKGPQNTGGKVTMESSEGV